MELMECGSGGAGETLLSECLFAEQLAERGLGLPLREIWGRVFGIREVGRCVGDRVCVWAVLVVCRGPSQPLCSFSSPRPSAPGTWGSIDPSH